jgi:predicted NBD/HSP70 family sugar kinase
MSSPTLGIDVSGHMARLALVDGDALVAQGIVAANRAGSIKDAAKKAAAAAKRPIGGVAVALPAASNAVPDDLTDALRAICKRAPTAIAAGTAAAIAEQWRGAARGVKQVISFSIGQHVTAGVIVDGKAWRGAHGLASSIGWLALNPVEREDYRRLGALEAEVAAAGIVRRFVWRIKSGDESSVSDQAKGDFSKIAADDILQGARAGDGVAISVMRDTAKYVGMAVANLVTMFDPEMVVLGGIIASSGDILLEAIRTETSRRLMPEQSEQVRIVLSTLGDDAAAIGAARAAI